ncbi:hypothetical protein [Streptomyces sp. NPDC001604]|uniref:hypothetical protein n=1 Tax=Streptomyces sp. NPDC001604 TaxID=3364593 RepID=UPI003697D641
MTIARAQWAHAYRATRDDPALAERAHPPPRLTAPLPDSARWAAMAHVLDLSALPPGARGPDVPVLLDGLTWAGAAELPRKHFPYIPYAGQEA